MSTSASASMRTSTSASTSASASMNENTSHSMTSSESMQLPSHNTAQSTDKQAQVTKETLPDTGQATSQSGLFGAVAAMLAGIGLIKKSRKDKKDDHSSSEQ
ncbi:LPXTG cell wall anchor domain-containing protein [Staphylococcus ursi]|nr:LPXTG cell wall anchor domain-containing protein [Staphylococcus sp. MI 10-1553]